MVYCITTLTGVWVVTKVILPKLEDIQFPDVKFDADCSFVNKIRDANPISKDNHTKYVQVYKATDHIDKTERRILWKWPFSPY